MKANEILAQAAKTYEERNEIYKDNYYYVGHIMSMLFPNGLNIKDADDWNRIQLIVLNVVKQTRYCQQFSNGGHQDSIRDQIVYGAMLEEMDGAINANKKKAKEVSSEETKAYTTTTTGQEGYATNKERDTPKESNPKGEPPYSKTKDK